MVGVHGGEAGHERLGREVDDRDLLRRGAVVRRELTREVEAGRGGVEVDDLTAFDVGPERQVDRAVATRDACEPADRDRDAVGRRDTGEVAADVDVAALDRRARAPSAGRSSLTPRDEPARHVEITAPVIGSSAARPEVFGAPLMFVNWPADDQLAVGGADQIPDRAVEVRRERRDPFARVAVECGEVRLRELLTALAVLHGSENLPPMKIALPISAIACTGVSPAGSVSPTFRTPVTPHGMFCDTLLHHRADWSSPGRPASGMDGNVPGEYMMCGRINTCVNGIALRSLPFTQR